MEKIKGVYFIVNKINQKFYVGHSLDILKRFNSHKSALRNNCHHSIYLQRAWNKYGEENFDFIIIKKCESEKESIELEQLYIDKYKDKTYNVSDKADFGGDLLTNNPNKDLIIEKIKNTINKKIKSMTEEERKLKFGLKGEKNPMFGKNHTDEAKKKMVMNSKGKIPVNKNKKYEEYMTNEKAKKNKKSPF